ncbi:MAG: glycosyltransferase [Bacteroidetes bacterium]|nr:glycosyltransferase [Bacteroidota bacterium]
MIKNKHIVIITPGFPKDETDDNCIPSLQQFVSHISEQSNDFIFSIITLHYPYTKSEYKWNGINIYSCGGKNIKFPLRFFTWRKVYNYFKEIITNNDVSLIHSFWLGECALIGNKLSNKYNFPHINTLMGQELSQSNKYLKFINLDKLKIVALSKNQAGLFGDIMKRNVDVTIPWGIDNNDYVISVNARIIDILGVGSLIPVKRFEQFVRVIKRLKETHHKINALLIGSGKEKDNLENIIASNNLKENIKLTGEVNRSLVIDYMSQSKILLHTSIYESFGYVFAEALASGMYIVSYNVGAANKSDKWLVAKTEDEIISHITLLLNSKLFFKPINLFPIQNTIAQYEMLYNSLLKS